MKVIFMGTPDFAIPSLNALVKREYEVLGVVTQADRPKDRGHNLKASPIKEFALAHDIPVFQPKKISKEQDIILNLKSLEPDVIVTCAFGQILPQSILDIPALGTINVHASLLPKYRGAAPIQWAVINGDSKTGITTMFTDIGLDTGDMLMKNETEIPIDMTAGELHDKMSLLGAETLIKTLVAIQNGTAVRTKQDSDKATYAPKIEKTTGQINWRNTSRQIHDIIRGTNPWPVAYTEFEDCRARVWKSSLIKDYSDRNVTNVLPGTILKIENCGMYVKTGDGVLLICEVQMDSCKRMTPQQYACGHEMKAGMRFNA